MQHEVQVCEKIFNVALGHINDIYDFTEMGVFGIVHLIFT